MRAHSIYDREGNSYRYARREHNAKELEERVAMSEKWDDLYKKAVDLSEKDSDSDKSADAC